MLLSGHLYLSSISCFVSKNENHRMLQRCRGSYTKNKSNRSGQPTDAKEFYDVTTPWGLMFVNEMSLSVLERKSDLKKPGFRIWSDINWTRIQPLRTKRIRIHDFFKTWSGSGSRKKTDPDLSWKFPSILWWPRCREIWKPDWIQRILKPDPDPKPW